MALKLNLPAPSLERSESAKLVHEIKSQWIGAKNM